MKEQKYKFKPKYNVIGLAGRKRSGKSMLAAFMKEEYGAVIVTIASGMKKLACKLLHYPDIETLNMLKDDKYNHFDITVDRRWVKIIAEETNIEVEKIMHEIGGMTFHNVREVLQIIGTNLIRKYKPNWHVDKMIDEIMSYDNDQLIVVDDVRFPNEREAVEKLGGKVYFIIRPNYFEGISNHESEISLTYQMFDKKDVIINNMDGDTIKHFFRMLIWAEGNINLANIPISLSYYPESIFEEVRLCDDKNIIKEILQTNVNNPLFSLEGIIFHRGAVVYNPILNETLKLYLK